MKISEVKKDRNGIIIKFQSDVDIHQDGIYEIKIDGKSYYFSVLAISASNINPNLIIIEAKEYGYCYARFSARVKDADIRMLVNQEIYPITDELLIKEINERACNL